MAKKYVVRLTKEERCEMQHLVSTGKAAAWKLTHARILLLADAASEQGQRKDQEICDALGVSLRTVERVRQRFVEEGLEDALHPKPRPRIVSKVEKAEGDIVELAKSDPPKGRKRWTLRLLAEEAVQLTLVDSLSHESIRKILKKTD